MPTTLFTNPDAPTVKLVKIGNGKSHHLAHLIDGVSAVQTFCGKVWTNSETNPDTNRCKRCAKVWDKLTAEFWADDTAESVEAVENRRVASASPESDENLDSESTPSLVGCFMIFNDIEYKIVDQTPDQVVGGGFPNDWLIMQAQDGSGRVLIQVRDIEADSLTVTPVPTRPVVKVFPPLRPTPVEPAPALTSYEIPLTLSEFLAVDDVEPVQPRDLDAKMPIGHVIEVGEFRNVSDAPKVYAPEVYVGTDSDGQISDGHESDMISDLNRQGWSVETGWSGQYSYSGPIMHPSEFIGRYMADHILDNPGFWVACEVTTLDTEEPAGWVLLHRETAPSNSVTVAELDSNPWNPAPAVVPAPRKPFTPADLDAMNLRRHVGSKVQLFGGPRRFARLSRVLPRVGSNPPAVMVEFPNGHSARYSLANVLLAG